MPPKKPAQPNLNIHLITVKIMINIMRSIKMAVSILKCPNSQSVPFKKKGKNKPHGYCNIVFFISRTV